MTVTCTLWSRYLQSFSRRNWRTVITWETQE